MLPQTLLALASVVVTEVPRRLVHRARRELAELHRAAGWSLAFAPRLPLSAALARLTGR